ncbi:uracil phosphoribosyltransferase [Breznakibacter xylanolyticus]|uniref:Uracil phosphoribosyltransferase n=1 Tax=Breznakibacter xylanolyticus TaxID=990 RepID=A0A2W7NP08_9BACT|nr:uracil phosphoribosyltransferase [Breznakibacter xylanolyticus]MBN2744984.1 uracil phosphoribosyltransferase [Marinilabiliaceae bacterium]PZX14986.1 uracil phosphoribosyltransferase [Breznakibacter xylanolyticus]
MQTHLLSTQPSLLSRFIAELRDKDVQTDPMRFRRNLQRIGEIFAYEISKTMTSAVIEVPTPLGVATERVPDEEVVVASVLRAGLPLHDGVLSFFDRASNAFVSAYRKYTLTDEFNIHIEYIASPNLDGKTLILCDPMLATGSSIELVYNALLTKGHPAHVHIVSVVASQAGVDYVQQMLSDAPVTLWLGVVDEELNAKAYIVPGLGDAGDLAYGKKVD